jgi:hypothetical protein
MSGTGVSDVLCLDLGVQQAGGGDHRLRADVTDLNTGAKAERETTFWVQK